MTVAASEYTRYFTEGIQTKIRIRMADSQDLDLTGLVCFIKKDRLTLDLVGSEAVEDMPVEPGSEVVITLWTGWSLCRCNAVLMRKIYGRRVLLQLSGPVNEQQTREFFRLDVSIPLSYSIPGKQMLSAMHDEWLTSRELLNELPAPLLAACPEGFKVVRWNGQGEIAHRTVNLSGGGLMIKTSEYVKPQSLVVIDLFLPLNPPRIVHIVAETLRCNEIVFSREKGNSYITAICFHFISDKDRESIIAFIFAEQRRILSSSAGKGM